MKTLRWLWILLVLALALSQPLLAAQPWQILENCEWVEARNNDGDSFKVRWNDGVLTIRLYFVDTPEVDYNYRDRVEAQAEYFGIMPEQAIEVGKMARDFTRKQLFKGFSVRTRWQGVFGGERALRKYGIVTVKGRDLGELLVANGLARIHGMGIRGKTWDEVQRLRELEDHAKAARKGAWGLAS